jgi:hypothetical protein
MAMTEQQPISRTPDIRTRLVDALREAAVDRTSSVIERQVDALLSLPGIAIMDTAETLRKLRYNSHDLGEFGKFIRLEYATAILAAADAAEAGQ